MASDKADRVQAWLHLTVAHGWNVIRLAAVIAQVRYFVLVQDDTVLF